MGIICWDGVDCRPAKLIEIVRKRFDGLGGVIFEGCSVSNISIYEDAAVRIPITMKSKSKIVCLK